MPSRPAQAKPKDPRGRGRTSGSPPAAPDEHRPQVRGHRTSRHAGVSFGMLGRPRREGAVTESDADRWRWGPKQEPRVELPRRAVRYVVPVKSRWLGYKLKSFASMKEAVRYADSLETRDADISEQEPDGDAGPIIWRKGHYEVGVTVGWETTWTTSLRDSEEAIRYARALDANDVCVAHVPRPEEQGLADIVDEPVRKQRHTVIWRRKNGQERTEAWNS